ncbi:MAG TPA: oxygen-independent coproporphyrinogen III oxidase [Acetobacteraceae bacterium]|nr:oxygen-independent coproporphyrinogen III oxidase [Acetobacteraceae bacterium]
MNIADLIVKYDRRVPRYTSYPTAPHFSPTIAGGHYAGWLAALSHETPLSLYLHVPFCASLCLFCACHTTVVHHPEPLISYGATLQIEITNVAGAIGRRLPVRHIHWGGGTPTALPPAVMRNIMTSLRTHFDVLSGAELAVEVDPRALSDESVEALGEIGVTRASLGVQDFDPDVQEAIHRLQDYALTANCAERLRKVGIRSINLDLIYGLPHQTVPGVAKTVQQALQIAPDRVAVFGYAHVPWMKKHQALLPADALPDATQRFAQREVVEQILTGAGYTAIGLDHFARPDDALTTAAANARLRRNFQGYTTDDAPVLVGLGASSIGSLPQGYVQNNPSVPAWRDAVRGGLLPIARGIALTVEDRLRRTVIDTLMCTNAVDLRAVAAQYGTDPATLMSAAPTLQALAKDGLVQWDGMRVVVTPEGRPFVRAIAATFDTYLGSGNARHSTAV